MAFGPRITIGKPKVTLGKDDQNFIGASVLVPGAGGFAGILGVENDLGGKASKASSKLGRGFTSAWDGITGKNSREAAKQAAQMSEQARRDSVVKEFGAREQADALAYAGLGRQGGAGSASGKQQGTVGAQDAPGTIGANLTSSGTF